MLQPTICLLRRHHDSFLKRLYRAGTPDALSLFLPQLARRIDWRHWQWIDKEVPIKGRRGSRSVVADLVGLTRDREGRYLKVLIHPELQMRPDATMDERVLEYNAGLLLQEWHPQTRVLTVVFYHCAGVGGIQRRRFSLDFYEESLYQITYWSAGLGDLDAEAYAEGDNPMGWALASWMRQPREQRVELRLRLMEKILRLVRRETYQELLLDTIQSYYKLSRTETQAEERLIRSGRYGEVEAMAQTVMERREARARREALQGAVQQAILTRFPEAPASLVERVERVRNQAALEELLRRVILAPSLAEIEALLSG